MASLTMVSGKQLVLLSMAVLFVTIGQVEATKANCEVRRPGAPIDFVRQCESTVREMVYVPCCLSGCDNAGCFTICSSASGSINVCRTCPGLPGSEVARAISLLIQDCTSPADTVAGYADELPGDNIEKSASVEIFGKIL
ncbi:unnamed protein product [Calypogeia fissa]